MYNFDMLAASSMSLRETSAPESETKQSFRERLNDMVENLSEKGRHIITAVEDTISDFKSRFKKDSAPETGTGIRIATSEIYHYKAVEAPRLGSTYDTLLNPASLADIYDKFPAGAGGRFYGFGERPDTLPLPAERLKESPIDAYWEAMQTRPDDLERSNKIRIFKQDMQDQGINPEELAKLIARELPTRVEESFNDACAGQLALERALISGASLEDVQHIIQQRDKAARLSYLMSNRYAEVRGGKSGWARKGRETYSDGMQTLVHDLESRRDELHGTDPALAQEYTAKIAALSAKKDRGIGWGDVYRYEEYAGSREPYAAVVKHPGGHEYANLDEAATKRTTPNYQAFIQSEALL